MTAPILPPTEDAIDRAARIIRDGGLVAFPTETVYGLGADATDDRAVARIYEAKGRPRFNPLIVHVPDLAAAEALAVASPAARRLAEAVWPGPVSLVLPVREGSPLSKLALAGNPTVALRCPAHPLAGALLRACGRPVAAPSANPSGRVSPTTAAHVAAGLGDRVDLILDGGATDVGVESTILALDPAPRLLREGGLPVEEIEAILGQPVTRPGADPARPEAPGQLTSHYAPRGTVRLDATEAQEGETLVGFGVVKGDLTLSAQGDLAEAAARLFSVLHELDAMGADRIAVAPIPETGLGRAINDRLRRAAAPRG